MANKGNGDAELTSDPSSSSLSSKKTTEKNEKPEEIDRQQHLDVQKKDIEKDIQHKEKQLEDTIQKQSTHRSDPNSNPDLNTTVESVNSSEPKKEQEEEMTPNLSSCQTRNNSDTKPNPQSIIKADEESDNKTDKKEKGSVQHSTSSGLPQISRPENVQENEKETIQEQSSNTNDPKPNLEPDSTVEIKNSNELQEKLEVTSSLQDMASSGLPQESQPEIVKMEIKNSSEPEEKQEVETGKKSSHGNDPQPNPDPYTTVKCKNSSEPGEKQEVEEGKQSSHRKDPESNSDPNTTVKIENSNEPEEKQEVTSSLQDMASSGLPQESQPEIVKMETGMQTSHTNYPKSNLEPDSTVEIKNSSELQEKLEVNTEEEETARNINEENVERDENEVQDQDQNLQSQIIVPGNNKTFWICAVGVILLAAVCAYVCSPDSTPPKPNEFNVVNVFNQEMEKLETSFPNQRPELWRRSLIHLRRHLKTKSPSEPVSLILTSGHRAEKTLDCLARCLARAFTTALNSSVLNIYGKSKASQDSDQVKLDIDRELRNAFEGEKSAAVIHRFEELPPGSTLIFYRYCDHENAAYKNVFLAFTVMLDAEVEVPSNVSLGRVEEMVQEHIKQKFVSSDKSAVFNQMDVDKLSGLWSRISHLILPVAAEEKIEQQGCGDCDKSF